MRLAAGLVPGDDGGAGVGLVPHSAAVAGGASSSYGGGSPVPDSWGGALDGCRCAPRRPELSGYVALHVGYYSQVHKKVGYQALGLWHGDDGDCAAVRDAQAAKLTLPGLTPPPPTVDRSAAAVEAALAARLRGDADLRWMHEKLARGAWTWAGDASDGGCAPLLRPRRRTWVPKALLRAAIARDLRELPWFAAGTTKFGPAAAAAAAAAGKRKRGKKKSDAAHDGPSLAAIEDAFEGWFGDLFRAGPFRGRARNDHYRVTAVRGLRVLWETHVLRVPGFSFGDYRLHDGGARPPGCAVPEIDLTTDDTIIV